ncbi:hypothetical protein [Cellulomonas sp. P24]|nr:hypothetical protein [Cellulomonas sp. P24]MCR6494037.1 hypothetical protein [Cellulomonas sp. P24]
MHAALLMAETTVRELPAPAPVYGIVAFGLLIGLLLVTFAFRSVGTRH